MFDTQATSKAIKHVEQLKLRLTEIIQPLLAGAGKNEFTAAILAGHLLQVRTLRDTLQDAQNFVDQAYDKMTKELVPAAFEKEGLTSFNLKAGYRITISQRYLASIIPETKPDAYVWLRKHKMGDIITETVNAGTLSATGKAMLEEGKELPESLFRCYFQPNTSITKS